jgi:hypothetical protein
MSLDLSLLSDEMERALEAARLLAERRKQSLIQPEHLLYTLFDHESNLFAVLEKNGIACGALLDALVLKVNDADSGTLEPGRRPVASQALRHLLEASLNRVSGRPNAHVEPIDVLFAAVDRGETALKTDLREAGITKESVEKIDDSQKTLRQAYDPEKCIGDSVPSHDDLLDASKSLQCEIRTIKAIAMNETKFRSFDNMGRPIILFERHCFCKYTFRKYDSKFPFISNASPGGYSSPEPDQWVRLQHAYALDPSAAFKSASWGMFQTMGFNHPAAGYGTVEQFVRAMCQSAQLQLDAFVNFVKSNATLRSGMQHKNWAQIAYFYNGPGYAKNHYDTVLADHYNKATD